MKAILLGVAAAAAAAQSADAQQKIHQIDIDSSALNAALAQLARQTDIQLARFSDSGSADTLVGPLHGAYTLEQALGHLLAGTGMTYRFVNERTVAIVKATAAGPQTESAKLQNSDDNAAGNRARGWWTRFAAFFAACGSLSATAPVCAQDSADPQLEEIVITGSRVITNGNDSPTPVTVVTTEELTSVRPGNLAEALNDMPVFAGSRSQNSNTGTSGAAGSPATSNNAGNVVNLRQMGLLRTLILYDGHRAPPSTPDGFVDIVTGGASAVYGSDAITGAVNFVTDTFFEGIKGHLQAGRSTYGDADSVEGGLAFGTSLFDGRGHLMGSFESRHASPIDSKLARPWGRDVRTVQGSGTAQFPYVQLNGVRQNNATFGGRVNGTSRAVLGDTRFASGGYLVPFAHGSTAGISNAIYEQGGDGGYYFQQLRAGLDMNQGYGRFDFDFTDDLRGYFTVVNTVNHSIGTANNFNNTNLTISRDNAYLLPQYRTALVNANQTTFSFGKIFTAIPRNQLETYSRQWLINTGLEGSFGGGYKWGLSYTNSSGSFDVRQNAAIDQGRFFAALDSVVSNGVPVCRAALTNAAYAGCVPLNPFGVDSESREAINYFVTRLDWDTKIGMDDVAANITGAPFSTWAGPVNAALSAEWRKLTYQINSHTPSSTARANCAVPGGTPATILNCVAATQPYTASVESVPQVSTTVSEAAVEFAVPMLKDVPGAQSLDMNLAYRFAHYDRAGDANTWKVGMTWDPFDTVTVRATRSRDFRAPSLDENFRALNVGQSAFPDFINVFNGTAPNNVQVATNNIRTENGGNPDLKPEISDTLTYGVVFRPTANFDIAVDAFKIKIRDAIFNTQGNNPFIQQSCYASGGSSPFCGLIGRQNGNPVTGTATSNPVVLWRQVFFNAAVQETWGADVEAGFRTAIASRPLSLRVLATYQPHLILALPGAAPLDFGGVAFGTNGLQATPRWRVTGFVNFKPTDSLTLALQHRWRSSLERTPEDDLEASPPVKSVGFTNVNVSYRPQALKGAVDFFLNVQNVFNTDPPAAGFYLNPNPGQFGEFAFGDDVIGRYYTAGIRFRM